MDEQLLDIANDQLENGDGTEEMYERRAITCPPGQQPIRLDKFIMGKVEGATRNKVQQAIEAGFVTVNGKRIKANYKVKPADEILIFSEDDPGNNEIVPEELELDIVYEDDQVLVINKPDGMVVHPGCGNYEGTLINGVAWHLQQQNPELDEKFLPRFGLVHRIDKNTSGLIVMAKTPEASVHLAKQFFDHTVKRKYIALVWGDVKEDSGTIRVNVGRHQRFRKIMDAYPDGEHGKDATTHYKVIERLGYVTLIECVLETGRTHQIRVHMKYLGHPLFNDDTYGGDRILKGTVFSKYKMFVEGCFAVCSRHALHAQTLGFVHPKTGEEMFFESKLPEDMEEVIDKWRRYAVNKNIIS
ncbi:MAG: RluA family pseudouridine synthase [Sphingobacteriales bacterium]|nr:MAG: RluA family pseudouridine synthase [Sphingobacteriales bacterium]